VGSTLTRQKRSSQLPNRLVTHTEGRGDTECETTM
jgi:hypothetical protein